MTVGERVREVRGIKTLNEFSEKLGVKAANISSVENNRSQMSLELAIKISEVYGVSLDWLLKGTGTKDGTLPKLDEHSENYITITKDELISLQRQAMKNKDEKIEQLQKQVQTKNINPVSN
ncbi:helix-turn-helix domain-containing protein [Runella sp.]|uniref:helix-turn-helix domain-containing protein n=1 Tax=Runella sp. TaxID=1960881 RepID=UPI003D126D8A